MFLLAKKYDQMPLYERGKIIPHFCSTGLIVWLIVGDMGSKILTRIGQDSEKSQIIVALQGTIREGEQPRHWRSSTFVHELYAISYIQGYL